MELIKAVHECKKSSESNLITGVRDGPLEFTQRWGFFTWMVTVVLAIATGGAWIGAVLGWHLMDILNPKYRCQSCGEVIKKGQYRI
jgi:hypothetical protein